MMMVKPVNDRPGFFLQDFEVNRHPDLIKALTRNGYFDFPVVTVESLTLAPVVSEGVGSRKGRFY
jgi:hypothetical protein